MLLNTGECHLSDWTTLFSVQLQKHLVVTLKRKDILIAHDWRQLGSSEEQPWAPRFAKDESQPLSPLMANRWVSQNVSKNKKLLSKNTPPAFTTPESPEKILTIADVSQTIAFMGTWGCPCSRKFSQAKNRNPCLRFEPRGQTHSLSQLRSWSTNQIYGSNRLQNTSLQIFFFFFY